MLIKLKNANVKIDNKTLEIYPLLEDGTIDTNNKGKLDDTTYNYEWYLNLVDREKEKVADIELELL